MCVQEMLPKLSATGGILSDHGSATLIQPNISITSRTIQDSMVIYCGTEEKWAGKIQCLSLYSLDLYIMGLVLHCMLSGGPNIFNVLEICHTKELVHPLEGDT